MEDWTLNEILALFTLNVTIIGVTVTILKVQNSRLRKATGFLLAFILIAPTVFIYGSKVIASNTAKAAKEETERLREQLTKETGKREEAERNSQKKDAELRTAYAGKQEVERQLQQCSVPKAEIQKIWIEYGRIENTLPGMEINIKLSAENLRNVQCRAAAFFYQACGNPLKDVNNRYFSLDGNVAVAVDFTPREVKSSYQDQNVIKLFLPYDELHITAKGKVDLKLYVRLYVVPSNETLASSENISFSLTYS